MKNTLSYVALLCTFSLYAENIETSLSLVYAKFTPIKPWNDLPETDKKDIIAVAEKHPVTEIKNLLATYIITSIKGEKFTEAKFNQYKTTLINFNMDTIKYADLKSFK